MTATGGLAILFALSAFRRQRTSLFSMGRPSQASMPRRRGWADARAYGPGPSEPGRLEPGRPGALDPAGWNLEASP